MNIFILDRDPVKAARMLCDKHVNKMRVESAQMLSMAHWSIQQQLVEHGSVDAEIALAELHELETSSPRKLYKLVRAHSRHPCTLWAMSSLSNYRWLAKHAQAIEAEQLFRYGTRRIPTLTSHVNSWCERNEPPIEDLGLTSFAQAMYPECRADDPVQAYRSYYLAKRFVMSMKWQRGREAPSWFVKGCEE